LAAAVELRDGPLLLVEGVPAVVIHPASGEQPWQGCVLLEIGTEVAVTRDRYLELRQLAGASPATEVLSVPSVMLRANVFGNVTCSLQCGGQFNAPTDPLPVKVTVSWA
jgi:hypothetical protein